VVNRFSAKIGSPVNEARTNFLIISSRTTGYPPKTTTKYTNKNFPGASQHKD
jgi:hypothetical protein